MGILQGGKVLESQGRGFIVDYYTTHNGTKLTKLEIVNKIMKSLRESDKTGGQLGYELRLPNYAIYNVLYYMTRKDMVRKKSLKGKPNIYTIEMKNDCLLHLYFYPPVDEIEKSFKVLGRKTYHAG